ncbi:unnamed protein product (macronuclear) [Paramecium tetraurelia]|uniref:Uncharacterized protein n=1 Tax=Paramecium tetraurelia TaxID=5888 RepID=A0EIH1_PARTE|nr:uncharacterized protein GSPATT00027441001 [Paramecium tetraurelia]CAK95112.1 unnamed protein product [Paramecium tetraurelia]|eukprot:XP_001462485.1 hypothetical protein (macronuclear) [Paramecium tetraurelia strain d4-2]
MRIQATSFRLPSLKLQTKDSYQCFSNQDNNLSNSSMIKHQSSLLWNYDPTPIKKRVRGMNIIIYNSHEKLKTADYYNRTEIITQIQETNQSTSVVNTFRRYRNKLKQLMQPSKNEGINSRNPLLYIFKDPRPPIRLDRLNTIINVTNFKKNKVRLLISSQQLYQEPINQDIFHVTLVKLKDEYDCLYQDFNDYYVQINKLDKHVIKLLNHLEIIQTLLKPKQPNKVIKQQQQQPYIRQLDEQSLIGEVHEVIEDTHQQSQIVQHQEFSFLEQNEQNINQPREPSIFIPLTPKQYNVAQSLSDLEDDYQNKPNKPKKQKNLNNNPSKPQDIINVDLQTIETIIQKTNLRLLYKLTPQNNQTQSIQQNDIYDQSNILKEDNNPQIEKPTFKRITSCLGSTSKRRNAMLESKDGYNNQNKVGTILEQDNNNQEDDEEQEVLQMDCLTDLNDEQQYETKMKNCINIYKYPFQQDWEFHIHEIIKSTIICEYDL